MTKHDTFAVVVKSPRVRDSLEKRTPGAILLLIIAIREFVFFKEGDR